VKTWLCFKRPGRAAAKAVRAAKDGLWKVEARRTGIDSRNSTPLRMKQTVKFNP
jgi:hypothetical protein